MVCWGAKFTFGRCIVYKTKTWKQVWKDAAKLRKKVVRQVGKDYVFFP
jgi:hypothetical protein